MFRPCRSTVVLTQRLVQAAGARCSTQRRSMAEMSFTFASPAEVFYKESDVKQVDVPSFSGAMGILANHVPTIAVLSPGVVTVHEKNGDLSKYFVSSGQVTVNEDSSVQILAEEACTLDALDPQAIREGLARAQQDVAAARDDRDRAEAQVAADCYEALSKAV